MSAEEVGEISQVLRKIRSPVGICERGEVRTDRREASLLTVGGGDRRSIQSMDTCAGRGGASVVAASPAVPDAARKPAIRVTVIKRSIARGGHKPRREGEVCTH